MPEFFTLTASRLPSQSSKYLYYLPVLISAYLLLTHKPMLLYIAG